MRTISFAAVRRGFCVGFALAGALVSANAHANWSEFDGGGRVGDYLAKVSEANASGARTEISGVCASACTMKLGARNACVHSDTQLWFHAARNPDGQVNALGTLIMMQEYPHAIRAWASHSGALLSTRFSTMSGAQAIALGVSNCDHDQPSAPAFSPRISAPVAACYAEAQEDLGRSSQVCTRPQSASITASSPRASFTANVSLMSYNVPYHRGR